jgi:hypothetical protein
MKSTPESRRRHLRWRQTAIYGCLIGAVGFVAVMAVGMWRGDLAPVLGADFKVAPSEQAEKLPVPCPSGTEVTYPEPATVVVQVLNGSGQTGVAAAAADVLAGHGFPSPLPGNAPYYDGLVKLVAGTAGIDGAYTVLQFVPEGAVIVLDRREDQTVDLVIGRDYERLRADEEVSFDAAAVIAPLDGCAAAEDLLDDLPPLPPPDEGGEGGEGGVSEENTEAAALPEPHGPRGA